MIKVRLTTTQELSNGYYDTPNAIDFNESTQYFTDKALIELQTKLNTFAIHIVDSQRELLIDAFRYVTNTEEMALQLANDYEQSKIN